ncbi:hypothetical protein N7512_000430 [Penicillium capsulatum]|nr:hypothetical protein N7512_000430 [Penicillium capsulatum]
MDRPRHINDLADELLSEVLSFVVEPGSRALNAKAYLKQPKGPENHHHRHPAKYGETSDLDRFRLVCHRFMRIGTPRKFLRFNVRFSEDGFRRLGDLLDMQLACYVKTVTYLVRPFYQGSGWAPILRALDREHPHLARLHTQRLQEQNKLIESNYDRTCLRSAIMAFSALQEIKLLRLQDEADELLIDFVCEHSIGRGTAVTARLDWESACSRAVTSLGVALLDSKCTAIRFIGPQISPEATLQLLQAPSATLAAMGSRLTSLDINFNSNLDITATMSDLSGVFHRFFTEAKNLVAINIGFPPKMPLDLEADTIFHGIRWKTLRTLSLQGWRLSAADIISLARRHRRQLRDFRLVAVYLRSGSRWDSVLSVLRDEMDHLRRLDLHDIDYAANFDAVEVTRGVEVFDEDSDNESLTATSAQSSLSVAADTSPPEFPSSPILRPDSDSYAFSRGHGAPLRRASLEKMRGLPSEELGDDGIKVHCHQSRLWEAWVLSGRQHASNENRNGRSHAHHI